jgi:hypothetical protein
MDLVALHILDSSNVHTAADGRSACDCPYPNCLLLFLARSDVKDPRQNSNLRPETHVARSRCLCLLLARGTVTYETACAGLQQRPSNRSLRAACSLVQELERPPLSKHFHPLRMRLPVYGLRFGTDHYHPHQDKQNTKRRGSCQMSGQSRSSRK